MSAIDTVAKRSGYTRDHVRAVLMRHRERIKAKKKNGQWSLTEKQVDTLTQLVIKESSPRYKLGETGPRKE